MEQAVLRLLEEGLDCEAVGAGLGGHHRIFDILASSSFSTLRDHHYYLLRGTIITSNPRHSVMFLQK